MGTVVHPDGAGLLVGADVLFDGNHVLGLRVALFPNAQVERSAVDIGNQMNLALMLGQGGSRRAPGESPGACAFVDWDPIILDERRISDLFIVRRGRPAAAQVRAPGGHEGTSELAEGGGT